MNDDTPPTETQILAMTAGLPLDALVATRVMGLEVIDDVNNYRGVCLRHGTDLPFYSSRIDNAWAVVSFLAANFAAVRCRVEGALSECCVDVLLRSGPRVAANAESMPLAVCRAALLTAIHGGWLAEARLAR